MISIGKYNTLKIAAKNKEGLSLTDGTQEVLLPYQYVPENVQLGDEVTVFVFVNKAGNTIATTQKPFACINEFAFLTVVDANDDGAFLDLGIDKDIFVPTREQKRTMLKGESYVVFVYLDEVNNKMLASARINDFIIEDDFEFDEGDEVNLLITEQTDLGFNAIISNKYIGLLYHNELFANLKPGEKRKGWIKKVRVGGKIDLSLQPIGFGHILDTKTVLLKFLRENGGKILLGDKSTPEEIYQTFQISKSAFKKAIGGLYKERIVTITDFETALYIDGQAE